MQIKKVETYITFDGKEFANRKDAEEHEATYLNSIEAIKKEKDSYIAELLNYAKGLYIQTYGNFVISPEENFFRFHPSFKGISLASGYTLSLFGDRINMLLNTLGLDIEYHTDVEGRSQTFKIIYDPMVFKNIKLQEALDKIDNFLQ